MILSALRKVAAREANSNPVRHSALWRLHQGKQITYEQWLAGVTFQQDELGSRDSGVADYMREGRGGGGIPTAKLERQAVALRSLREAWAALCEAGAGLATDTYAVCVHDRLPADIAKPRVLIPLLVTDVRPDDLQAARNVAERAILTALRRGLDALASHYRKTGRSS